MRKVPKLRFKEFSDEWEEKKLGDFITINGRIGFRGYTVNDIVDSKEKGAIALSPTNLLENKIDFSKLTYISNFKYEESPEIKLQVNDIVLVKTGSSYGKVGFLTNLPWKATINPQLVIIKTKLNKSFIYYFMNTFIFQNQIEKNIVGGAIPTLSQESIKKFKFFYTTIQEQEKIANFLSSIDKKIYLTEEKLELFREYKKGVMQKVFSQELRFKDSNGNDYPEWEEKRLGEILKEYYLGSNYKNSDKLSNFPLIKMGNLDRGKINLKKIEYIDIKENILEKDRLEYGTLLFNTRNTPELVGKVAIWKNELPQAYFNSNLMKMVFDNNFFMNYKFNTNDMIEKLKGIATGTTSVGAIYTKDLLKLVVVIPPSLEEQQKIADFLSSIDNKIESIEKELEGLKEFKKGLLQQMFV
jgi:type I restriction enzyme S subunit